VFKLLLLPPLRFSALPPTSAPLSMPVSLPMPLGTPGNPPVNVRGVAVRAARDAGNPAPGLRLGCSELRTQ